METLAEYDLVFVDTAGFSHKNEEQREDIKKLVNGLDLKYEKEVYLVLSATTKYKDLMEIVDIYREIAEYKIIFTKLDETIFIWQYIKYPLIFRGRSVLYDKWTERSG